MLLGAQVLVAFQMVFRPTEEAPLKWKVGRLVLVIRQVAL
jgi:hypothetical protein